MPCAHCGGSGVRCCEFGADRGTDPSLAMREKREVITELLRGHDGNQISATSADAILNALHQEGYLIIPGQRLDGHEIGVTLGALIDAAERTEGSTRAHAQSAAEKLKRMHGLPTGPA